MFEIHETFRRGLFWKNASQIHFHQFYNLLRDVFYKKLPCTRVAVLAVLLSISENISASSTILNSRTLSPQIRSRERKFEQRLARGLFWSRLSNLITIPDCSVLSSVYNVRKQLLDRFCLLLGVSRCSSGIYSRSFISFIPMIYLTSFVTVLASYSQMIRPYTALQN